MTVEERLQRIERKLDLPTVCEEWTAFAQWFTQKCSSDYYKHYTGAQVLKFHGKDFSVCPFCGMGSPTTIPHMTPR